MVMSRMHWRLGGITSELSGGQHLFLGRASTPYMINQPTHQRAAMNRVTEAEETLCEGASGKRKDEVVTASTSHPSELTIE
jgi:hypothetical protein